MYRLICQKPAHFLSAQMALVGTFFQMFIVLGMYNFACRQSIQIAEKNDDHHDDHTNLSFFFSLFSFPHIKVKLALTETSPKRHGKLQVEIP